MIPPLAGGTALANGPLTYQLLDSIQKVRNVTDEHGQPMRAAQEKKETHDPA